MRLNCEDKLRNSKINIDCGLTQTNQYITYLTLCCKGDADFSPALCLKLDLLTVCIQRGDIKTCSEAESIKASAMVVFEDISLWAIPLIVQQRVKLSSIIELDLDQTAWQNREMLLVQAELIKPANP